MLRSTSGDVTNRGIDRRTAILGQHDAFDADRPLMLRCACGQDHAPQAHDMAVQSQEDKSRDFMEAALVKALFPVDSVRRGFLKAVGVNTARAAIASRSSDPPIAVCAEATQTTACPAMSRDAGCAGCQRFPAR